MDILHQKVWARPAMNPATKLSDLEVGVRVRRIKGILRRKNAEDIYTASYTLGETLRSPDAIFEGLRFDVNGQHRPSWFCYAKHPERRYDKASGKSIVTPDGQIFLAFVNDKGVVYNWTFEDSDRCALTDGKYLPDDYKDRFGKQVYGRGQT